MIWDVLEYLRLEFGSFFDLMMRVVRWTGLVAGPIFLVVTLGVIIRTGIFLHQSVATSGTVTGFVSKPGGEDGIITYAPIFVFSDSGDQRYTVTSDTSSNPPEFKSGQSVRILYRSANPQDARIATFWQLWTFAFVAGIFSLLLLGVGYGLYRYERWRDHKGLSILQALPQRT